MLTNEMTDKELLELAAKAAGYRIKRKSRDYGLVIWNEKSEPIFWNPLTEDGDALRLAVKLHMCLDTFDVDEKEHTVAWKTLSNECRENHNDDPYTATRRAIVRAAAEIGKEMK